MDKTIQLFTATFSDGTVYSLILNENGKFEVMIDNEEERYRPFFTEYDELGDALKFIKDWSEEILKEVAE